MTILIGNAPCSWGVEFPDDPRNPSWSSVLDDAAKSGYKGIELGPIGFLPEDANILGDALKQRDLTLIGGVIFQAFHDKNQWDNVMGASIRTCKSLVNHGAQNLVLIDSISPIRAKSAGRPDEADQMDAADSKTFTSRFETIAKMATEEYGLSVSIHAHAGGYMEFEPELLQLLNDIDEKHLKICLDTAHAIYAGFDPIEFYKKHASRISYIHLKDIDPKVRQQTIENRTDFYTACGNKIFCRLGEGAVDFKGLRTLLAERNYQGWVTVEQDIDPLLDNSPLKDATDNLNYLKSVGY